ncbi:hypothetical protein IQ254_05750 [Nodosilinea sp. LEGE 07088]|uniref:hypothetical protein n=1 Tax=Nodosilinea sp. LEGE 07088 TaxID=2777968 RepID=UPI00187FD31F|nr:hypothetical protein [Nodosilinea sp. LEGE 07088]MBE9136710.1 hypothetical protein [Nodosilinea sp. LEGE 07088]
MTLPTQRRRSPDPNRPRQAKVGGTASSRRRSFGGLWLLCGLFYAAAGLILTALSEASWLWLGALAATVLQGGALAGPRSLQRFQWLTANLLVLGSIIGGSVMAAMLSIALNHLGTDNLNDLTLTSVLVDIVLYSCFAVGLAVLCSLAVTALGDQLLRRYSGRTTSIVLIATNVLGLALGGALGLLLI